MRKFELLFLAIAFMTTKSNGQTLQPSDLADKIVYAFQTKDFEIYKKLSNTKIKKRGKVNA